MSIIDKYELNDGSSISIARSWGCNLMSWVSGGEELIYCPPDLPDTAQKITGGGNPLLFPSVGRTWDFSSPTPIVGLYKIYGHDKAYFMPSHGILFFCEFNKVEEERTGDKAMVLYEAEVPAKVREGNYPFDVTFAHRFTLTPEGVDLEAIITNKGDVPAPAAFGYHPYLRVSSPSREGVEVHLPVKKHPLLTEDTVLFTGEVEDTDGIIKLQPDIYYDLGFTEPTGTRMSLIDPKAGRTIHVDYDEQFELFFLYSPDGSEFVCIEPWTRGLGAFGELNKPGWENGELIPVMKPGEVKTYRARFGVCRS